MPYMSGGKRDYKKEYEKYAGTTKAKKDRAARNAARSIMVKAGKAHKGDNKDVGHIKALSKGGLNKLFNLSMQSKTANRSFSKTADSKMKSEKSKRESGKKGGSKAGY